MNKLKTDLQNDLNLISKRIDEGYNNNDVIAQNIEFLLCVAEDQHINLKETKTIGRYIDNYEDEEECAKKEYIDNYHEFKDFNVALCNIGEKINNEYQFKIVDPKFKSKVNMDDSIRIVSSFFKKYDKDIYDY